MTLLRVKDLNLTVRAQSCLRTARITFVRELIRKTRQDLLAIRNMGLGSVMAIERALGYMGLRLGMEEAEVAEWHRTVSRIDPKPNTQSSGSLSPPIAYKLDVAPKDRDVCVDTENPIGSQRKVTEKEFNLAEMTNAQVRELNLDVRAHNCLRKAKIELVGELVQKTRRDLLKIRGMGKGSIKVIEHALEQMGLRLGMRSVCKVEVPDLDAATAVRELHRFIETMEILKLHGIDDVGKLVDHTPDELFEQTGLNQNSIKLVEIGLKRWGLRLRSKPNLIWCRNARTFKDELLHVIPLLLSDSQRSLPRCFIAYHGITGKPSLTLQKIADNGIQHGFDHVVSRERVRQVLVAAETRLRTAMRQVRFSHWDSAIEDSKHHLPSLVHSLVSKFGYESVSNPRNTYKTLEYCAQIFNLDFPFAMQRINGVGSLVIANADESVFESLSRLPEVTASPYTEMANVIKQLDCDPEIVCRTIELSSRWEFLDESRRYFWKRPLLPPRNYGKSGNPILTGLCKVFSVTNQARASDLARSVARFPTMRRGPLMPRLPIPVLEGIAERSGLFDVRNGVIQKKSGLNWCSVTRRDVMLLRILVEHGRTVPSNIIYTGLVHAGLSKENASVTVAYSPFLVHTQAGIGFREGIYKFVPRREDIDLAALDSRIDMAHDKNRRKDAPVEYDGGRSEVCLSIPISSRARLSGTYYAPSPTGLDGEWQVQDNNGDEIGRITISGRLVVGLGPVISSLGLSKNELLELRPNVDRRTLVTQP